MSNVIIALAGLIIALILFIIVLLLTRTPRIVYRNAPTENEGESAPKQKKSMFDFSKSSGDSAKKPAKGKNANDIDRSVPREDIFRFMQFDRITDGMIVQANGKRYTKALRCKGINYDLMSEAEQMAVEQGFITFLNTLKYPIQLYVQAQNVNLKDTISKYKANTQHFEDEYNEINREYARLSNSFDVDEKELAEVTKEKDSITNVYEYSKDIIKYVEKMQSNKNMLQRSFYVLLSYSTSEISASDKFNADEKFEMCATELTTRCLAIQSALTSCSVTSEILDSNDLAELLYAAYNRDDTGLISVKESLDSGFYRLYSVSEDAFTKEQDELDQYMQNQAKIRALEAIKYAIENDEITTPAMEELQEEEEISRTATNMVNAEAFPDEFKDKVDKKILNDYRETKKELLEVDKEQKEVIQGEFEKDRGELERLKKEPKPHGIELIEKSEEIAKQERQMAAFGGEEAPNGMNTVVPNTNNTNNTNTNNTTTVPETDDITSPSSNTNTSTTTNTTTDENVEADEDTMI